MLNGTKRRSRWAILASRTISLMGRYIFCQTKLNMLLERNCSSMAAGLLRPKSLMPSILLRLRDYIQLGDRSEEHTSELQSLLRISYAVFCLKKKYSKNDSD